MRMPTWLARPTYCLQAPGHLVASGLSPDALRAASTARLWVGADAGGAASPAR